MDEEQDIGGHNYVLLTYVQAVCRAPDGSNNGT